MSSADVRYSVVVDFGVEAAALSNIAGRMGGLQSKVKDLGGEFAGFGKGMVSSIDSALSSVTSTIVDGVTSAAVVAGGALVAGLGAAVKEGFKFGEYVESSTNGLAATLGMLGNIPIDQGLRQAQESVENLRKAAAVLPGEFKDALGAFSSILPAGLTNGVEISRLEKLGAQSVAVAASLGIAQNVAGHELAAMLEGRARSSMPLVARLGVHATDWNKQDSATRFAKIEDLFGKMDPAMQLFAQSFEGLSSTARDNARNVAKTLAAPLFSSVKRELGRGLAWFGQNEDAVHAWATRLGLGIEGAFTRGVEAARYWFPIVSTFAENLYGGIRGAFSRVEPLIKRIASHAERFMLDPSSVDRLVHGAELLLAAKAGTSALSFGATAAGSLGPLLGSLGGAEGLAGLASAAGPAAVAIAALGVGVFGAVDVLTDGSNRWHDTAVASAESIAANSWKSAQALTEMGERARPLVDLFGVGLITAADRAVQSLTGWVDALDKTQAFMMDHLWSKLGLGAKLSDDAIDPARPFQEVAASKLAIGGALAAVDEMQRRSEHKIPKTSTHVTNNIRLQLQTNADPNRIAATLRDLQHQMTTYPTSSKHDVNRTLRAGVGGR